MLYFAITARYCRAKQLDLEISMNTFKIAYWAGLLMQIAIRAPYQKGWKSGRMADRRVSAMERGLLGLLTL